MQKNTFRISIISLLTILSINLSAQKYKQNLQEHDVKPYHFGFILAANTMDFRITTNQAAIGRFYQGEGIPGFENTDGASLYGVSSSPAVGFTVGVVGNYKIAQHWDFRFIPSLAFGERNLNYRINRIPDGEIPYLVNHTEVVSSTFLEFPFHLKYKSNRAKNFRAYVLAGFRFNIDLAAPSADVSTDQEFIKLRKNDLLYEVGAGFDFYFPFFKFGIELKGSYGTKDLLLSEGNIFTDGIQQMRSKLFQVSLTFE